MVERRIGKPDGITGRLQDKDDRGTKCDDRGTGDANTGMVSAGSLAPAELGCDNEKPATNSNTADTGHKERRKSKPK